MSINGKKVKKFIKISAVLLGITFVGMFGMALKKKKVLLTRMRRKKKIRWRENGVFS